jgi:hypothetical protein
MRTAFKRAGSSSGLILQLRIHSRKAPFTNIEPWQGPSTLFVLFEKKNRRHLSLRVLYCSVPHSSFVFPCRLIVYGVVQAFWAPESKLCLMENISGPRCGSTIL